MMLIIEPAVMADPSSKNYPELFEEHHKSLNTWKLDNKGLCVCVRVSACVCVCDYDCVCVCV